MPDGAELLFPIKEAASPFPVLILSGSMPIIMSHDYSPPLRYQSPQK